MNEYTLTFLLKDYPPCKTFEEVFALLKKLWKEKGTSLQVLETIWIVAPGGVVMFYEGICEHADKLNLL